MPICLEESRPDLETAIRAYNGRIDAAGISKNMRLPEPRTFEFLPNTAGHKLYEDYYLATEDGAVRGGYLMTSQEALVAGESLTVAETPEISSEAVLDRKYNLLVIRLIRHALARRELQLQLGVGPDLTRIFEALKWRTLTIPLYLRVGNGFEFARQVRPLRKARIGALAMDTLAYSGAAWAGARAVNALLGISAPRRAVEAEEIDRFGGWADDLWDELKGDYSLIATRDQDVLNVLYPARDGQFTRLKVTRGGRPVGWAVVSHAVMPDNQFTGNMRVGIIRDCLARPQHAAGVIWKATETLMRKGVDVLVSNQSHPIWRAALRRSGFVRGPSNLVVAMSPELNGKLAAADPRFERLHITRDGRRR